MKSKVLYILSIIFSIIFFTISFIVFMRQLIGTISFYTSLRPDAYEYALQSLNELILYIILFFILSALSAAIIVFLSILFRAELKNKK